MLSRLTEYLGDFYLIYAQLKVQTDLFSRKDVNQEQLTALLASRRTESLESTSFFERVFQLFSIPRNRRAVVASCIAMISQCVQP